MHAHPHVERCIQDNIQVSQDFLETDGLAKSATDPGMHGLPPQSVQTMGNYFQHNGYDAVLKGKWHLTDSSIALNDGSYLPTYDEHGVPILKNEQFYLEKNVLNEFGYENWIGPEPHGSYAPGFWIVGCSRRYWTRCY